jgi:hypothetical protein
MDVFRYNLRRLVVPTLVLSLLGTGISSSLQVAANCGAHAAVFQKARVCCCKGGCHGQCGMACCQKPASNPDQLPPGPKSHEDSGPSMALVSAIAAGIDFASAGASGHRDSVEFAASDASPSLLALNVRFNV